MCFGCIIVDDVCTWIFALLLIHGCSISFRCGVCFFNIDLKHLN